MNKSQTFLFSLLLVAMTVLNAFSQEYDSDSIYYTPIAKPKLKSKNGEIGSSKRIEYFFNIQTGALVGCNDCSKGKEFTFSVLTVQGITIGKKLRTGLGMGFDSYQNWQTLPLFGMVSWDLIGNKTRNALFVQMNYGWAHPWFVRDGFYSNSIADPFSDVNGGKMINPQIGYRISYFNLRLLLVAGYKFQSISYKRPNYYYCPTCDLQQQSFDDITQDMNRVQVMMAIGWK
jgi:hypothetical protein